MMMASSSPLPMPMPMPMPLALALALARLSHPLLFIRWLLRPPGKLVGNPFFVMEEAEPALFMDCAEAIEMKF
jgi:hypothetical protein